MQLGKYSSDRDNILHFLVGSGWGNEQFGDIESPVGHVSRISNNWEEVKPINAEFTSLVEDELKNYSIEDGEEFRKSLVGHFLVVEDSQGFVSVTEYPTEALLLQVYESLENIYSEGEGE